MRYNISGFNVPDISDLERTIAFTHDVMSSVIGVVGARVDLPFSFSARGVFSGEVALNITFEFSHLPNADVFMDIDMHVYSLMTHAVMGNISSMVHVSKRVNFLVDISSAMTAAAHAGKLLFKTHDVGAVILPVVRLGKFINYSNEAAAAIVCFVSMGLSRYSVFKVDATIPPGGEIRIDSNAFTCMRGQENILHLFSGDWVFFVRNTAQLVLDSGSGGEIDGEVIYNARYI